MNKAKLINICAYGMIICGASIIIINFASGKPKIEAFSSSASGFVAISLAFGLIAVSKKQKTS